MAIKMQCLILFHFTLLMGTVVLEPFQTPCELKDTECLRSNIQQMADLIVPGKPELDIASTDPILLEFIEGKLFFLNFEFYNSTLTGLKTCTFKNISLNEDASRIHMEYDCPGLQLEGKYKIMALLFITSHGNYKMESGRYLVRVDAELERVNNNGNSHLQLKEFNLESEMLGILELVLFPSSFLVNMANDYIKDNYKTVALQTQKSVWSAIIKKHFERLNQYLITKLVEDILI